MSLEMIVVSGFRMLISLVWTYWMVEFRTIGCGG